MECLQQATADQAFTNAKAANDVPGMVAALMYRALERNTPGPVGRASNPCTSIKATNPEIAAIQQHQDPASPGAAGINKAVTLELAKQIKAVGGDPLEALKSGTFQPGDVTDATGKGNTCKFLFHEWIPLVQTEIGVKRRTVSEARFEGMAELANVASINR